MSYASFAQELRKWWSFDDRQMHTHSWHAREDFIKDKMRELIDAETKPLHAEIERLRADRETYNSWAAEIKIGVDALRADNERLRKGIQNFLDGNYNHPRTHRHEPAMGCVHGRPYWESCDECDANYFSALLGEEHRGDQQTPPTKQEG